MAGLLDDPARLGLLQFGLGMLQAGGPNTQRVGLGQGIAAGAQQGIGAYQQQRRAMSEAEERAQMKALRDAQMAKILADAERAKALAAKGISPDDPSDVRSALWFLNATPEQREAYNATRRAPPIVAGVPIDPLTMQPRMSPQTVADWKGQQAQQTALGAGMGGAATKIWEGVGPNNQPVEMTQLDRLRQLGLNVPGARLPSGSSAIPPEVEAQLQERIRQFEGGGVRPKTAGEAARAGESTTAQERAKYEQNLIKTQPQAIGAMSALQTNLDQLIDRATSLKNDPGKAYITGYTANFPFYAVKGSPGFEAHAKLQNIKDKIVIETMKALKELSATGATGFGNLTEREGARLENNIAPLSVGVPAKQLDKSLDEIISWATNMKRISAETYQREYGSMGNRSGGQRLRYNPQTRQLE